MLAFACVFVSAFACVRQRLSAFVCVGSHLLTPPLSRPPLSRPPLRDTEQSEIRRQNFRFTPFLAWSCVKCYDSDTQALEKIARGNFTPNFMTPLVEEN